MDKSPSEKRNERAEQRRTRPVSDYVKERSPDGGVFEAVLPAIAVGGGTAIVLAWLVGGFRWFEYYVNESDTLGSWMHDLGPRLGLFLLFAGLLFCYAVGLDYYAWLKNKRQREVLQDFTRDTMVAIKRVVGLSSVFVLFLYGIGVASANFESVQNFLPVPSIKSVFLIGVSLGTIVSGLVEWRSLIAGLDGLCAWITYLPGVPRSQLGGWRGVLLKKHSPANPLRIRALTWFVFLCVFCAAEVAFSVETPIAAAFDSMVVGVLTFVALVVAIVTPASVALGQVDELSESEAFKDAAEHVRETSKGTQLLLGERSEKV